MSSELVVRGKRFEIDHEGYLENEWGWEPDVAEAMAEQDQLVLTPQHWEIINLLREYLNEYNVPPSTERVLIRTVSTKLGSAKGNSQYLLKLFPAGPIKQACRLAGLPKPSGIR